MNASHTRVIVSIPRDFLQTVDSTALAQGMNRSTFIRVALMEKLGVQAMVNISPGAAATKAAKVDPAPVLREKATKLLEARQPNFKLYDPELKEFLVHSEIDKLQSNIASP